MHIRLETTDGKLIHETEIPPGHNLPDVVMWQCRCFVPCWPGSDVPIYREATVYHLNEVKSDVKEPSCASET